AASRAGSLGRVWCGMGATFGLGIVACTVEVDAPRETAVGVLRAVAGFAGGSIRDVLESGEVVEVAPDGAVTTLAGQEVAALAAIVEQGGGSSSYASFQYLDGFHILVAGGA